MKDCLIAGGGICGVATALAIANSGRTVRVFEKAEAFEEVGAGLQISPNAVRALQHLGVWDAVQPICTAPREIQIRDAHKGRMLKRVILGKAFEQRFGASYRVAHRADLLHALLGIVRGKTNIELATGREVRSAEGNPGGVAVSFPDGSRKKGEMLIACDGIHSALRRTVYPHSKPRDSGLLLYRALLPAILVPREIDQEVVTLWLRPGGHTVHYAVSGGRNFSIVHVCPSPPKGGAKCPIVLPPIADLVPELASLLAEPEDWLAWPGLDLDPLPHWRAPWGLFLGDAAHASLPFLAQGAAMALEDAATLAKHLVSDMSIGPVFEERRARTARIQRQSRQQARIYHAQGIKRLARNTVMAAMSDEMFMNRLAWIYDWQA